MYITVSALTMEEAELMFKILDKALRRYFNTYGMERRSSWNRHANDGIRAQIVATISREQWEMVKYAALDEMARRLIKTVTYEIHWGQDLDLSTAEASIDNLFNL